MLMWWSEEGFSFRFFFENDGFCPNPATRGIRTTFSTRSMFFRGRMRSQVIFTHWAISHAYIILIHRHLDSRQAAIHTHSFPPIQTYKRLTGNPPPPPSPGLLCCL